MIDEKLNNKYIKLSDLEDFPIRLNNYDREHGKLDYILGIESVIEYAEYLPAYDLNNMLTELKALYDLVNENQKSAVKQAINIVNRNFKEQKLE